MNIKVLIQSKNETFITYTKQVIQNTHQDLDMVNITERLLQTNRLFKEYFHDFIIFDVDSFEYDGIEDKTIKYILQQNSNCYILCVSNDINYELARIKFKLGVNDYITLKQLNYDLVSNIFYTIKERLNTTHSKDSHLEKFENQLSLIRDGQHYDQDIIDRHLKKIFPSDPFLKRYSIFFRIDNIMWVYAHHFKSSKSLKYELTQVLTKYVGKHDILFFTKKHSGFFITDKIRPMSLSILRKEVNKSLGLDVSFFLSYSPITKTNFLNHYRTLLDVVDKKFYLGNNTNFEVEYIQEFIHHQCLKDLPNNFRNDILYRFEKRDYRNIEYFIQLSLEFMGTNMVRSQDVKEFYIDLFLEALDYIYQKDIRQINAKKEVLEGIRYSEGFYQLSRSVNVVVEALLKIMKDQDSESSLSYVELVEEYVKNHISEKITLHDLSNYVGISSTYICRLFKEKHGENLMSYINRTKIYAAIDILNERNLKVQTVSQMVGFADPLYFSRVFKNINGISPKEYIKMRRENHE